MLRHAGIDGDVERQALLLSERLQTLGYRLDGLGERHRFDGQLDLAGLDLREVEDVVDQREQVVAGGEDRLREGDLLVRQVAALVVGQQLGKDQLGIERRAQLVAHVRQELALVLIRSLELGGLFGQPQLRVGESVVLVLEDQRLFLELRVDLFELGLLALEPRLRFLEHAALLFELLVADAELLLLRLQLFGLPLRFFEQFFEPRPIP